MNVLWLQLWAQANGLAMISVIKTSNAHQLYNRVEIVYFVCSNSHFIYSTLWMNRMKEKQKKKNEMTTMATTTTQANCLLYYSLELTWTREKSVSWDIRGGKESEIERILQDVLRFILFDRIYILLKIEFNSVSAFMRNSRIHGNRFGPFKIATNLKTRALRPIERYWFSSRQKRVQRIIWFVFLFLWIFNEFSCFFEFVQFAFFRVVLCRHVQHGVALVVNVLLFLLILKWRTIDTRVCVCVFWWCSAALVPFTRCCLSWHRTYLCVHSVCTVFVSSFNHLQVYWFRSFFGHIASVCACVRVLVM